MVLEAQTIFLLADGEDILRFLQIAKSGAPVRLVQENDKTVDLKFSVYLPACKDLCSYAIFTDGIRPVIMSYNFKYNYLKLINDEKLCEKIIQQREEVALRQKQLHGSGTFGNSAKLNKEKRVAPFVLALIGAIFGLIGGIVWSAFTDLLNTVSGGAVTAYLAFFIILGIGGAIVSLVGGTFVFVDKKGGLAVMLAGLVCQVGMLTEACIGVEGFSFLLNLCTLISIILLVIATILAYKKS